MICAGGIFFVLTFIYMLVALESKKAKKRNMKAILNSYSGEQLKKMEYDVAFYEQDVFKSALIGDVARQVTIDDLLSQSDGDAASLAEGAVFTHVEDEGKVAIRGNYNPER